MVKMFNRRLVLLPQNQKGIAHIVLLLLLLLGGVVLGTYLVQNRTNILPFASQEEKLSVPQNEGDIIADQYIVVLKDPTADVDQVSDELVKTHRFVKKRLYKKALKGFSAEITADKLDKIRKDPKVRFVTPDRVVKVKQAAINGLQGEYFDNSDLTNFKLSRTDLTINFNWGASSPVAGIGSNTFSVRWTGQIQAPKTESYTFYAKTDDGVRLWVNNQLIIDNWVNQLAVEKSGTINLSAGQKYPIKMEYFDNTGSALAQLRWSTPTLAKQIIPKTRLFLQPSPTMTPTPTPKPSPSPTASPAGQLFNDDFEDGNSDGWSKLKGVWGVNLISGRSLKYIQSDKSFDENISLAGDSNWSNYSVEGVINFDDDNGGVCLLGRVQADNKSYQLELKKDQDGVKKWWIWRNDNDNWNELASGEFNYLANMDYILKFELNDNKILAFISSDNGQTFQSLGTAIDPNGWSSGKIGLKSYGNVTSFDNIKVTLINNQTLPTGVSRIGLNSNNKGNGITVAVIDTGIELNHPDLAANIIANTNCIDPSLPGSDGVGHGTHVAGIIAALDNSFGVRGVAPEAKLASVKVFDDQGFGSWSSVICGIDWVTQNAQAFNIKVVNMSLAGGGQSDNNCGLTNQDALHKAICDSVNSGLIYIAGAGNDLADVSNTVPAAYDDAVITVSALADSDGLKGGLGSPNSSGLDDTFYSSSNYGSAVDLAAPGVDIFSTYLNGGYTKISGTSMATPHVSAAAAMYIKSHPGTSWTEVRDKLKALGELLNEGHTDPLGLHPESVVLTGQL